MGRPAEFDEAEALERAMSAFWRGGYDATGLDDLVEATGLGRQSLYNTFGDKRGLFLRCLRLYNERGARALRAHLEGERPVGRAFASLFESILREGDEEKRRGCFMINAAMELAPRDVEVGDLIARHQRVLEDVFTAALQAGRDRGELAVDLDVRAVGRFLVGTLLGVTVLAKSDPRSDAAGDMVRVALQVLRPAGAKKNSGTRNQKRPAGVARPGRRPK